LLLSVSPLRDDQTRSSSVKGLIEGLLAEVQGASGRLDPLRDSKPVPSASAERFEDEVSTVPFDDRQAAERS